MPLRSLKLKWVWQAQFLSHTLQILEKVISFEDLQMILLSFLEIFITSKVTKNVPRLSVQVWRSLWFMIQFYKINAHEVPAYCSLDQCRFHNSAVFETFQFLLRQISTQYCSIFCASFDFYTHLYFYSKFLRNINN